MSFESCGAQFELWFKHKKNPRGRGEDAGGVESRTALFLAETVIKFTKKHFSLKNAPFPTENKVLEDNDAFCPKVINLQMETSIHTSSLYPSIHSMLFIKLIQVNKEVLFFIMHKVLCATPVVSGKLSLHHGSKLNTNLAHKE